MFSQLTLHKKNNLTVIAYSVWANIRMGTESTYRQWWHNKTNKKHKDQLSWWPKQILCRLQMKTPKASTAKRSRQLMVEMHRSEPLSSNERITRHRRQRMKVRFPLAWHWIFTSNINQHFFYMVILAVWGFLRLLQRQNLTFGPHFFLSIFVCLFCFGRVWYYRIISLLLYFQFLAGWWWLYNVT